MEATRATMVEKRMASAVERLSRMVSVLTLKGVDVLPFMLLKAPEITAVVVEMPVSFTGGVSTNYYMPLRERCLR